MLHSQPTGERFWITGVAGFIGRAVLMEARKHSGQMHISGIGRGLETSEVLFRTALDVAQPGNISPVTLNRLAAASGPPTHVIHLAAGASVGQSFDGPGQDFQRTVDGSACLFHWLGRYAPHARVVLASSAAVYGAGLEGPITEDSPCKPTSPYGWHKKIVEDLGQCETQTSGLRVLPARIFSAYGPGLRKQLFWDITQKLTQNSETIRLIGTGEEVRDWCHVTDVARTLIDLARSTKAFDVPLRPVNIASGHGVSVASAVRAFCAAFVSPDARAPRLCFSQERRVGDPSSLVGATERLCALELPPSRPFPADLTDTAKWYRKEVHNDPYRFHNAFGNRMDGRANLPLQPGFQLS